MNQEYQGLLLDKVLEGFLRSLDEGYKMMMMMKNLGLQVIEL